MKLFEYGVVSARTFSSQAEALRTAKVLFYGVDGNTYDKMTVKVCGTSGRHWSDAPAIRIAYYCPKDDFGSVPLQFYQLPNSRSNDTVQ